MENHNGWKRTFLVINKRVGPEFIIEQLEREGSWGRYSLIIIIVEKFSLLLLLGTTW